MSYLGTEAPFAIFFNTLLQRLEDKTIPEDELRGVTREAVEALNWLFSSEEPSMVDMRQEIQQQADPQEWRELETWVAQWTSGDESNWVPAYHQHVN